MNDFKINSEVASSSTGVVFVFPVTLWINVREDIAGGIRQFPQPAIHH